MRYYQRKVGQNSFVKDLKLGIFNWGKKGEGYLAYSLNIKFKYWPTARNLQFRRNINHS